MHRTLYKQYFCISLFKQIFDQHHIFNNKNCSTIHLSHHNHHCHCILGMHALVFNSTLCYFCRILDTGQIYNSPQWYLCRLVLSRVLLSVSGRFLFFAMTVMYCPIKLEISDP